VDDVLPPEETVVPLEFALPPIEDESCPDEPVVALLPPVTVEELRDDGAPPEALVGPLVELSPEPPPHATASDARYAARNT
jgi:hypothetical protein